MNKNWRRKKSKLCWII